LLDQGIDTSTAVGRMFFQILGAIAEFEHALMSERTRDGLDAARAGAPVVRSRSSPHGRRRSHRRCMTSSATTDDEHSVQQIADEFGVTRPTIYRHLQRHRD
jgi:DNA invertase Pin-like site-specific DNA recombinase